MRKGNNTMRVVFFSAARQVWGAEVSLLTLASALTDQGVDVVVVCPSGELADRAVEAGIAKVHAVPPVADSVTQGRMRDSQRLWQTCLRIARRDDHVVIFSYYLLAFAPVARPVLRARGVHVTLDLHDTLPSPKARLAVRLGSRAVDLVIACSRFTAGQLAHRPRVSYLHRAVTPPTSIAQVAAGDTTPQVARVGAGGPLRIGIVGRITQEKRHLLLIDAVAQLRSEAVLVVRGADDGFSDGHAAHVMDHGRRTLGDRFIVQGRVPLATALAELDVLVVGNPQEPMGRTVLEAQAQGVVAVVPDSGGASELVEDGVTGLVYAHDDAASLARTIDTLDGDGALAARLVTTARQRLRRPADYADDYLSLLEGRV